MFSSVRRMRWIGPAVLAGVLAMAAVAQAQPGAARQDKVDDVLKGRAQKGAGTSRVIITFKPGFDPSDLKWFGGVFKHRLQIIDGAVIDLPNGMIRKLAQHPEILGLHVDRPVRGHLSRAAVSTGARTVQSKLGYDGAGIGVAVVDSGVTSWHDDLTYQGASPAVKVKEGQRVAAFVDFVNGRTSPYDDNGHGTHVAGIIAGNGFDTAGARAGIAPSAHLVSLKVLDGQGNGLISNVILALQWAIANKAAYNIRVVNLSVGAGITESYRTDPLTLAAKRAVDSGIVVVTAAGNFGKNAAGQPQYGGITAPGNAPWVLTVGASSTEGTSSRNDDVIAGYSSRGPSAIDFQAKPDVVAPGTGIVSLSDPSSRFYATKADYLLDGTVSTRYKPYLSLTGTSMAAPVVSGTVALMLQANPSLTPNLVKALLQYTAENYHYDALTQGAGFLNSYGAVQLAAFFTTARAGDRYPVSHSWSRQIIWGNQRLSRGILDPRGNAWASNIVWGTAATASGENIVWGTACRSASCENIVWGTASAGENIVWGTASGENIVWGTASGENIVWGTASAGENIVWGTARQGENIVWGTANTSENIVWGTDCGGADCLNVIWGAAVTGENIVWGTASGENIVWGTASGGENIVWGTASGGENIVWGTAAGGENIVWGTASGENIVWGTSSELDVLFERRGDDPVTADDSAFESFLANGGELLASGGVR